MDANYDKNVFINCPFDEDYQGLKQSMMFAVKFCGFNPHLVSMDANGAEPRIDKIKRLIEGSRYGIHDISRCKATTIGEWYRMNMPFEMGLDFGSAYFSDAHKDKKCLVLTADKYSQQPSLSDISGNDPKHHDNDDRKLRKVIRDFFFNVVDDGEKHNFPKAQDVESGFESFQTNLYLEGISKEDILEMQDGEYCSKIDDFLSHN